LALLMGLVLSAVPGTQAVSEPADNVRISTLISQLASMKFSARRQASRELDAIGEPALAALRKAVNGADMEACHRARALVARIENRLDAAAVMAPTRVRLVCNEMPVQGAIAELARKARIEILIDPQSLPKLAQRKVTLDTGDVTFWEALEALCQKAGLVETAWQNKPNPSSIYSTINLNQGFVPIQQLRPVIIPVQPAIKLVPQQPKVLPARPLKLKAQPRLQKPKQAQPEQPKKEQARPEKPKAAPARAAKQAVIQKLAIQLVDVNGDGKPDIAKQAVIQKLAIQQLQAQIQLQPPRLPQLVQVRQAVMFLDVDVESVQGPDLSRIVLADGKPELVPTCYAGAFRIRVRTTAAKDRKSATMTFEVTAEPRHLGWNLVGKPRLEKAGDDRGRSLTVILEQNRNETVEHLGGNIRLARQIEWTYWHQQSSRPPLKRVIQIAIALGEKSRMLNAILGKITVEAKAGLQDLIVVDKILAAGGKTIKGPRGGSIEVIEVAKDKSGNHQVRFKLENPPGCEGQAGVNVTGNIQGRFLVDMSGRLPAAASRLALLDARGVPFPILGSSVTNNSGEIVQTLTFQAHQGRAPVKLIFAAQRNVNVDVPFSFKDIELP
jgi:hypothetical protein